MCGIAGCWQQQGTRHDLEGVVRAMTGAIAHRGPDADGHWVDAEAGLALGHRRLSILDLSPAGAQPMTSPAGRYVISFNGEVYNWKELRAEEERHGAVWRGHSDTEVILALADRLGPMAMLERAEGMFALALWDRAERRLLLARDRFGEKPLYWGWLGGTLVFASELRALRTVPGWQGSIDRDAVTLLLRHNYLPEPHAIYAGVRKLPPATAAWFSAERPGADPELRPYWSLQSVAEAGLAAPLPEDPAEVLAALDAELRRAIGQEMVADVPLGAFLSGGIDSSLIVALMQAQSDRPVRTFTIGFEDPEYDESPYARAVARHLGTDHTELTVTAQDTLAVIPELPTLYDEPFSDSSQVPTALVSRLARRQVTVSLSGDGGDELFGGYSRYGVALGLERRLGRVPRPVRAAASAAIRAIPRGVWDQAGRLARTPEGYRGGVTGDRVHKLAALLGHGRRADRYRALVTHWPAPASVVLGAAEPATLFDRPTGFSDPLDEMTYLDAVTYLPGDILVKVDRAAMAVSLETRAPYLHPRVAALAWRIPRTLKWRDGRGKWVLRQLLDRYVPRALTERPKMGFGIPIHRWLRQELREWGEALLDESRLRREGLFAPAEIRRRWEEHQRGERDWGYLLWDVLMLQAWLERQGPARPS